MVDVIGLNFGFSNLVRTGANRSVDRRRTLVRLLLVVEPIAVGSSSNHKKTGADPNFISPNRGFVNAKTDGGCDWTRTNDLFDVNEAL